MLVKLHKQADKSTRRSDNSPSCNIPVIKRKRSEAKNLGILRFAQNVDHGKK